MVYQILFYIIFNANIPLLYGTLEFKIVVDQKAMYLLPELRKYVINTMIASGVLLLLAGYIHNQSLIIANYSNNY